MSKPVESGNTLIDLFDLYKRKGESYSAVSFQHGHEMNEGFALAADYGVFEEWAFEVNAVVDGDL